MTHVILDGTLIESDRLTGVRENGNDLWCSKKHKRSAATCSYLRHPVVGLRCRARYHHPRYHCRHALPALYKAAAEGMPTLADKGYIGAGIGIRVPVRRPKGQSEQALHADTRATNAHPAPCHPQPKPITRAALVLNRHWK
jgi:hypothetical protein